MANPAVGWLDRFISDRTDEFGFFGACQTGVLPAERWLCGGAHGDFVCAQLCAVVFGEYSSHGENRRCADFGAVRRGGLSHGHV